MHCENADPDHSPLMFAALMIGRISLSLDVRLANDAAVVVVLFANESAEIGAAHSDRIMTQHGKLRLDFRRPHSCAEPAGELGKPLLWRARANRPYQ
jgi:hypothetical protein